MSDARPNVTQCFACSSRLLTFLSLSFSRFVDVSEVFVIKKTQFRPRQTPQKIQGRCLVVALDCVISRSEK